MPILAGRGFDRRDQQSPPKVVVINDVMARRYFGNENPIGRTITVNDMQNEVVGIVSDVKSRSVRDPSTRKAYVPFPTSGEFAGQISFEVRASGDVSSLIAHIRQEVRTIDPNVPLYNLKTMVEHIDQSLSQERLIATLATFFGLLALLLVCVGLYGVMSYVVVRRTKEIGIRMALGARRGNVLGMVLRDALILVLVGIVFGLPAALASAHFVSSLLFGIPPTDPLTILLATVLMATVTSLACYLPARRAARVNPLVALRYE
jgi:predicted permease